MRAARPRTLYVCYKTLRSLVYTWHAVFMNHFFLLAATCYRDVVSRKILISKQVFLTLKLDHLTTFAVRDWL